MAQIFNLLHSGSKKSQLIFLILVLVSGIFQSLFSQTIINNPDEKALLSLKDTTLATQYFQKGKTLAKAQQYDSSNFYFKKAKELYVKLTKQDGTKNVWGKIVECYNREANNYKSQGKNIKIDTLKSVLELGLKKLGNNHPNVASSYYLLGYVYWTTGYYDDAMENIKRSLSIRLNIFGESDKTVASSYNLLGLIYWKYGDYGKALDNIQKSLSIALKDFGENHPRIAGYYNNIGIIYREKGDYDKALEMYKKSLSISLNIYGDNHPEVSLPYNNIGNVYYFKTEYDVALDYFQKALSIHRKAFGENHPLVAGFISNIGAIYNKIGDYDKALEMYNKSLSIKLNIFDKEHPEIANSYNNLGENYFQIGDYEKAVHYYNEALELDIKLYGNKNPIIAGRYFNLAEVYESQGDFEKALTYCQKSIISLVHNFDNQSIYSNPSLTQISSERKLLNSLKLKAKIFSQLSGNTDKKGLEMALSTYKLSSDLIDKIRIGYKAEGSKLFLGETESEVYEQAIRISLKLNNITKKDKYKQQAFTFVEKSKAAVLQEGLAESQAQQFTGLPASLLENEKQLRIDLTFYDTQIQKEKLKKSGADSIKIRQFENRMFDRNIRYEQFIEELELNYPEYYKLKYQTRTATVKEIQDHLQQSTFLLDYFKGDSALYIFTISKTDFDVTTVLADSSFSSQVDDFYRAIHKAETQKYLESAEKLSDLLIKPVIKKIKSGEKLVIIPHDLLYKIPFEALLVESTNRDMQSHEKFDYNKPEYLFKNYDVSYHHSATLYVNSLKQKSTITLNDRTPKSFIGFAPVFKDDNITGSMLAGNVLNVLKSTLDAITRSVTIDGNKFSELKYTEQEVKSVVDLFNQNRNDSKNLGIFHTDATEESFKENIEYYRIVHIATHSFINEENPELSGIVFAQPTETNTTEDGILYSGETYNLSINADLVVLSSCESGLGKLVRGEGMMALTRGFLYSGAANIMFSLWKVPDKSTSELMIEFYRQMLSGKSIVESLRQAKLKMLTNPATARPRSWASFVIVGLGE